MGLLVSQSVVLGSLSEFFTVENRTWADIGNAYYFSAGLTVLAFTIIFVHAAAFHAAYMLGMLVRTMLTSAIYQKVKLNQVIL